MSLRDYYATKDEEREEAYLNAGKCISENPECACPVCNKNREENGLADDLRNFGLAVTLLLFMGCAGSSRYIPIPLAPEPCENLQYPNREPHAWELSMIKKLKAEGKCEDLRKYLETIR